VESLNSHYIFIMVLYPVVKNRFLLFKKKIIRSDCYFAANPFLSRISVPVNIMISDFRADLMAGKTIVITGGATGIGFGIATQFGLHGANVVVGSRRGTVVEEACKKLSAMGIKCAGTTCDVRSKESCDALANYAVETFNHIDVLVNNAAGNFMSSAEAITENGFRTVIDIDLQGSFNMSKACLPYLKQSGKGVIINITATLHYKSHPFQMHAAAAKAGIDVMTETLGVVSSFQPFC